MLPIFFSVHPYIGSTTVLPDYDDDDDDEEFLTIGQIWTVSFSSRTKVSQTLQSVLTEKYFVCVLVVLLGVRQEAMMAEEARISQSDE